MRAIFESLAKCLICSMLRAIFYTIGGKYILYDRFFYRKSKVFAEKFAKKTKVSILKIVFNLARYDEDTKKKYQFSS